VFVAVEAEGKDRVDTPAIGGLWLGWVLRLRLPGAGELAALSKSQLE
jgi:hypothetical protein